MMIPFMGMQSAVMAEQFGTLFQYGKRRISAMSNEEFNALTPEILQIRMSEQLQKMIPEMEKQIQSMSPLVSVIIREFANYIKLAITAVTQPTSGFEQTSGTISPTPPTTGSYYYQGADGKSYYYEDGVLISINGVKISSTTQEPIAATPTATAPTSTSTPTTTTEEGYPWTDDQGHTWLTSSSLHTEILLIKNQLSNAINQASQGSTADAKQVALDFYQKTIAHFVVLSNRWHDLTGEWISAD